jgi:STE24 endopeptidase
MNWISYVIIVLVVCGLILEWIVELLNLKAADPKLPEEFEGYYDSKRYSLSQKYLREQTLVGLWHSLYSTGILLSAIFLGLFNWMDQWARGFGFNEIFTGLVFIGLLGIASSLLHLPWGIYDTFVLEEKYGFNKTTWKTFLFDQLKGLLLSIVIGAPILYGVLWFFESAGAWAWAWVWGLVTVVQIFLMYIAPVFIMPLFNKYDPLEEGELKTEIETFAKKESFFLQGLFKMDGSKRSTKANAFFTGFGRFRRIVLFDTLIEKHSVQELVAILAHEIGHYKLKHIFKAMAISILSTGLMFLVFSFFIKNPTVFAAFKMESLSVYASLVFFGLFYSPISSIIGILGAILSRKHEFEADHYAKERYGDPEALITGLKKLSVDSLSNLTPHPLKVFLEYSHPPVLKRIERLRQS